MRFVTEELPLPEQYIKTIDGYEYVMRLSWGSIRIPNNQIVPLPQQMYCNRGADRTTKVFARSILAAAPLRSVYTYTDKDGTEERFLRAKNGWIKDELGKGE